MGTTPSPHDILPAEARDARLQVAPGSAGGGVLRELLPLWALESEPRWLSPWGQGCLEQIPGPDSVPKQGPGLSNLRGLLALTAAQRAQASGSRLGPAQPRVFLADPECLEPCADPPGGGPLLLSQWSPGTENPNCLSQLRLP